MLGKEEAPKFDEALASNVAEIASNQTKTIQKSIKRMRADGYRISRYQWLNKKLGAKKTYYLEALESKICTIHPYKYKSENLLISGMVDFWSLVHIGIVVGVSLTQVFMLKKFFHTTQMKGMKVRA